MKTIVFKNENHGKVIEEATVWKCETEHVLISENSFYDRIDETYTTVVCYYI